MKRTIINLLRESATKYAQAPYIHDKTDKGWEALSFKQTDLLSSQLAIGLMVNGFSQKDKIAILAEGRRAWVVSEFAILKIRSVSVPLSVKLLPEEIIFRLNHSESKAIFTSINNIAKSLQIFQQLDNKDFKIIVFDDLQEDKNKILDLCKKYNFPQERLLFYSDLINLGEKLFDQKKEELEKIISEIEEDDTATISYTSGTTGDPKGIMLTHKNYYHNTNQCVIHYKKDVYPLAKNFVILPVDHSFAHTAGIYGGLGFPLSLYFLDARGGSMQALKNIPLNLKEVQPYFLYTVPALTGNFMKKIQDSIRQQGKFIQWLFNWGLNAGIKKNGDGVERPNAITRFFLSIPHKIADILIFSKIRKSFGNYKFSIGGGALLDIAQQRFFAAIGMPIMQGYGLSEATPVISANKPSDYRFGTSGKPLPMLEVKIMKDGKEMPQGEKGEIMVKGDNVMKGYFKNPQATAKTIENGWLHTGDMGYIDQYGYLVVTGREKALLIGEDGEKYSPEEIEETIQSTSPFVYQIMLYNDHSKFTSAIITLDESYIKEFIKQNNITSPEELLKEIEKSLLFFKHDKNLKNKFPQRWLPKVFRIAPEPFTEQNKMLNSTLKIVRYRIIETYKDLIEEMYKNSKNISDHNLNILKDKFFKS